MATMVRCVAFLEREIGGGGMRVDRDSGVIRNVRVLGAESRNGRRYSPEALTQAAKLYEGCRVNIDHPDRATPKRERGFAEMVGTLRGVRVANDGVRADLHVAKSHPMADLIFESAERWPENFGLSHNAEGDTSPDGRIVESVTAVRSVDIVCRPATNRGLFESIGEGVSTPVAMELESQVFEIVRSVTMTTKEKLDEIRKLLEVMDRQRSGKENTAVSESYRGGMATIQRRVLESQRQSSERLREHLARQRGEHLTESDADYNATRERFLQRFSGSSGNADEDAEFAAGMASLRERFK